LEVRKIGQNANQGVAASARGMEIASRFFWEVGLPALETHVPGAVDRLAAGLIAAGSDCAGNDDEISRDFDWGPRFQVFLTTPDFDSVGVAIQYVLSELPLQYEGAHCRPTSGVSNHVFSIDDFFSTNTACGAFGGCCTAPEAAIDWLKMPEASLFDVTHGQVFYDPVGDLTERRQGFSAYYPDDAWRRRIVEALSESWHYGQDMLPRAIARDDYYTAQIAWWRFAEAAMRVGFLLNRRYAPDTKWLYREFSKLPELSVEVVNSLWDGQSDVLRRIELVTRISAAYSNKLYGLGLCASASAGRDCFGACAEEIAAGIRDPEVAALPWPEGTVLS
jgi:hypothetical protein